MTLEQKRKDIDEIDTEILSLLNRRANVVRELGQIKMRAGLPLIDWGREAEVIRRAGSHGAREIELELAKGGGMRVY